MRVPLLVRRVLPAVLALLLGLAVATILITPHPSDDVNGVLTSQRIFSASAIKHLESPRQTWVLNNGAHLPAVAGFVAPDLDRLCTCRC